MLTACFAGCMQEESTIPFYGLKEFCVISEFSFPERGCSGSMIRETDYVELQILLDLLDQRRKLQRKAAPQPFMIPGGSYV